MIELQKSNGGRRGVAAREDMPPPPITERAAPDPPPTIATFAHLRRDHLPPQKHLAFDDLRMTDDALFPQIEESRKFVCSGCGGRKVEAFTGLADCADAGEALRSQKLIKSRPAT